MTNRNKLLILIFTVPLFALTSCNNSNNQSQEIPSSPVTKTNQETSIKEDDNPALSEVELNKLYSHTQGDSPSPYYDNLVIESSNQGFSASQAFQLAQLYEDGNNGNTMPNLTLADHWFSYAIKNDVSTDNLYCSRIKQILESDERAMNDKAQQKLDIEQNGLTANELNNLTNWHKSNIKRYTKIISENCN